MTQKSRRLNVAHPLELFSQQRKEHKNIFQTVATEEDEDVNLADRFVAGAKEVRVYKNKLKRKQKQKLTVGRMTSGVSRKEEGREVSVLLTREEVLACLPKSKINLKHLEKSLKKPRLTKCKLRQNLSEVRLQMAESHLMKSIYAFRGTVEEREKSCQLTYLPNLKSQKWINTLRRNESSDKSEHILMRNKMMVAGSSKMRAEGNWLRQKQREGYGFQLLPNFFLSEQKAIQ